MDHNKILKDAKSKISELSKMQDEIYSSLLSDLGIEERDFISDYIFDYCFNDCDFDFDELEK